MKTQLSLRWLAALTTLLLFAFPYVSGQSVLPEVSITKPGCNDPQFLFVTVPAPERGSVQYQFDSNNTVTITSKRGIDFSWETNWPIDTVMVVAEPVGGYYANYYRYTPAQESDSGLEAPAVAGSKTGEIAYIQFCYDAEGIPPQEIGCVYIDTHWKMHSSMWPDGVTADAWLGLPGGEDEVFFDSGDSYLGVLWTSAYPPRSGHPYYLLAHEFIAAELNVLNGASAPSVVEAAWDAAEMLFETYTPDQVISLKGKAAKEVTSQFRDLAAILESFNSGTLGVPYCRTTK